MTAHGARRPAPNPMPAHVDQSNSRVITALAVTVFVLFLLLITWLAMTPPVGSPEQPPSPAALVVSSPSDRAARDAARPVLAWSPVSTPSSSGEGVTPSAASEGEAAGPSRAEAAGGSPSPRPAPAATRTQLSDEAWRKLRRCESDDRPAAVSKTGRYRGLYQFDLETWRSVGGSGDPAAASRDEQDMRAQLLYDARGAQPWPYCGRHLR